MESNREKRQGTEPPIPAMADRCPMCGEIVLRPSDGTEGRHGQKPWSPWTCPRCGYWWVDGVEGMSKEELLRRWPHTMVRCPNCSRETRVDVCEYGQWVTMWDCPCGARVRVEMEFEARVRVPAAVVSMKVRGGK